MATIQKIDKIISFNSTETEWTVDSDTLPDLAPFCHFAAFAPKKGKVMKKDADWYVNTNCVVAVSSSVYGVVDGITYYDVKLTFESEMSYCFVCNENVELHQDSL